MKKFIRPPALLCITIGFFGSNLGADEGVQQPAGIVTVPTGLSADQVQKAILVAGTGRGWTIRSKEDGKVVLFLEHGGWRAVQTLAYDTRQIDIMSNSDKLDRHGNPKRHAVPENWVKFLKQDIDKNLLAATSAK